MELTREEMEFIIVEFSNLNVRLYSDIALIDATSIIDKMKLELIRHIKQEITSD